MSLLIHVDWPPPWHFCFPPVMTRLDLISAKSRFRSPDDTDSHVKIDFSFSITNLIWSPNELVSGWAVGSSSNMVPERFVCGQIVADCRRKPQSGFIKPMIFFVSGRLQCPAGGVSPPNKQAMQEMARHHSISSTRI